VPAWVALLVAAAAVALMALLRLQVLADRATPIGYGVPLVAFLWLRDRRYLWLAVVAFITIGLLEHFWVVPQRDATGGVLLNSSVWVSFAMQMTDLLVIALLVHAGINALDRLDRRNAELESANREVAAREEELARNNEELHGQAEELQQQAEELERQAEELRVANDELARREHMLRILLSLSRSLTPDHTRGETLGRVCETLGQLLDHISASAILEQEAGRLVVRCHHGFDSGAGTALENEVIADEQSFAAIVMRHNRTAYIEDLGQRPDLRVPQPTGPGARRFVSVLAAPLRVAGRAVGTLEAYRTAPGPWGEAEVALIESLAVQTSVSLEAAELFQEVSQERRRLDATLRTAPVGITVANADGTEVRMNPAAAAMFGLPADANLAAEFAARPWRKFQAGRELAPEQRPIVRALRAGREVHGVEVELVLASGRRLAVLAHAAPVRDGQGAITGAVGAYVDISAQKELQRELDLRRREAEEASVRKTRFLAAVSHDIRTPANAISLLAELIRRAAANPAMAGEIPDLALELHGSAMALVNLLGDVLDLARFDSGRVEMTESEFSLAELLAEEHRRMQPVAREKGLDLHLLLPAHPVRLRADRIKLSRVVNNLLGNAIKFTERGEIRLEATAEAPGSPKPINGGGDTAGAVIRVSDTGIGIAPEHQKHIFDEFFQLRNPERDRNKGTGLGLTICQRLVDAMGGRLTVESEPGRGSTFTVALPPSTVLPHPPP
jgi:PAS domain S-box-containing protein